jgi:hypothetical protein
LHIVTKLKMVENKLEKKTNPFSIEIQSNDLLGFKHEVQRLVEEYLIRRLKS